MAVELGWTLDEIRAAEQAPAFFEGVAIALRARALAPLLERANVQADPNAPIDQKLAVARLQAQRARLLRSLRGDEPQQDGP